MDDIDLLVIGAAPAGSVTPLSVWLAPAAGSAAVVGAARMSRPVRRSAARSARRSADPRMTWSGRPALGGGGRRGRARHGVARITANTRQRIAMMTMRLRLIGLAPVQWRRGARAKPLHGLMRPGVCIARPSHIGDHLSDGRGTWADKDAAATRQGPKSDIELIALSLRLETFQELGWVDHSRYARLSKSTHVQHEML